MELIVANASGAEQRVALFSSYDFEVGNKVETNSFQITVLRKEWEAMPQKARLYIPGTEWGGLFRELATNTSQDIIQPGGITWRGMLYRKVISPEPGYNYAYSSGELNAIIKAKVEAEFPGLMVGSDENTGVEVTDYRYKRYCTLADGLTDLLKSQGFKLHLEYSQEQAAVVVSAVPIMNYSSAIEFSSDMRINYVMSMKSDGVNHLLCLGSGELKDRLVVHLYVDADGEISQTQTFFGDDEICEVYDYAGANEDELINSGTERLKELMNLNTFEINIESGEEIEVGDIVGGRDYLSGMSMTAPITGKILRWQGGFDTIEYKIEDGVTVGG